MLEIITIWFWEMLERVIVGCNERFENLSHIS